jgi:integrase
MVPRKHAPMPKKSPELSAALVRRLTKPGLHAVGGVDGLQLQVKESGARSWILRVKIGKRRPDLGLGGYPDTTLEQARQRAREARELIRQGIDPRAERRKAREALAAADARQLTFAKAARMAHAARAPEFRNARHSRQWIDSLDAHANPVLGNLQVAEITMQHVLAALEPIWRTKTETATRVRGRIEEVLAWATVNGYRSGPNPAVWKGNLRHALPAAGKIKTVRHHDALPWREIGAFMPLLRARAVRSARAIEFAILTAARSAEVRLATWDEIDLDRRLWTIPGNRMKAGRTHRVPLSEQAIRLLGAQPREDGTDLVFPSATGKPQSDSALSKWLREFLRPTPWRAKPHGFRSTFKDWARSCSAFADEVSELALAHVSSDETRAAYARDELLPQRAELMRAWADHCDRPPADAAAVIPIGRGTTSAAK